TRRARCSPCSLETTGRRLVPERAMNAWEDIQTLKIMIGATPGNADLKRVVLEKVRLATDAAAAQGFSQTLDLSCFESEVDVGVDFTKLRPLQRDASRNILFAPERARLFLPGAVLLSHELVPDREMEQSELYREFMKPLFFLMAAPVAHYRTTVRGFGVQRER